MIARIAMLVLIALSARCADGIIVRDTFADGDSQNQDVANQSLRLFNGRNGTVRTDQTGSVTFDITSAGGSEGFWAFFTDAGSPVKLSVGDRLKVAVTFSLQGFQNNGQDIRWGVLDSLGTRNTANLAGGMNDATFVNDPGYGIQVFASGAGSPFVLGRRAVLSNANVFNNFGDFTPITGVGATARQALSDNTLYTLTHTIERISETGTRTTAEVTGGSLEGLNHVATEATSTPATTFDYFAFRVTGPAFATSITFTELLVELLSSAPAITLQPQPSRITLQVGGNVTLAVGASGSQLSYQWRKDGQALRNNESATTPVLALTNVQLADSGSYTALVSNAGGSVVSDAVTLDVSTTPVAPPPSITTQPANTTIALGGAGRLFVVAQGAGLVYQWFKNGEAIIGASTSQLTFTNVQVSDAASYYVVISNTSGSVTSAAAALMVVSTTSGFSFTPFNGADGVCPDVTLSLRFDQAPRPGRSGRILIRNSRGALVDSIDMAANTQTKIIGGVPYVYYPLLFSGNTALITLHRPLPYNETYSVTIEPGVFVDPAGAPFAGIADSNAWKFQTRPAPPDASLGYVYVGADGSGDFCTVQAAIDLVPVNNTQPFVIYVGQGVYNEINYVPSNKPFLTVQGADRDGTVVQYPNNANLNSGNPRAMFGVDAPDFTIQDITLWNTTPKGGSQAEAFRGNNRRILLNRVNLKSFQDTLLLQGAALVSDSYIEGDVDFMWGNGAVYFTNTELRAVSSGGVYVQSRNTRDTKGYVYVNCRLTANPGVAGVYLARIDPGAFPYSQVVYINSAMGPHIAPAGWLLNNSNNAPNVQFWEYKNTSLDGSPLATSARLSASRQLNDDEAVKWSDPAFVLDGWTPVLVNGDVESDSFSARWMAPAGHSPTDRVALCRKGAPNSQCLQSQPAGPGTSGRLVFAKPATPGPYEFRYFHK